MEKFDLGKFLADSGVNIDTGNRKHLEHISIDLIVPDPENFYELTGIEDLAANIALCGLQQPLLVRPMPGDESKVVIISGHRRHAALKLLIDQDGRDDLRDVPCIVEQSGEDPRLTQLKLIYANASTRVLTSAEQAKQAEQVEKLLYELKESGMEFPGRMRDHVAQACKISTGKLARLKVIQSNLAPIFRDLWEAGKLRESVAYTLAGQTRERQNAVWNAQTENGAKEFRCTDGWCENLFRNMDRAERDCKKFSCDARPNHDCSHYSTRVRRAAGLGQYAGLFCTRCCKSCYDLASCGYSCGYADDEKAARKEKAKADRKAEKEQQIAKDAPKKELLKLAYQRVGKLRKENGISSEDFVTASLGWHYAQAIDRLEKMEAGSVALTDRMPGSIWPDEAKHLCDTADLLGCSIDYLLGHDVPAADAEERVNIDTGWRTGMPPKAEKYVVLVKYHEAGAYSPDKLYWNGCAWMDDDIDVESVGTAVDYWIPIPEEG